MPMRSRLRSTKSRSCAAADARIDARVVLDANVLVSAAIQLGPSHRIVQAWRERRELALVICPLLVDEVEDVLTMRPRLRRWIGR
jgi:predicted nucleic acid-binding protein